MQIYKTNIAFGRSFLTHVTGDTSADKVEQNMRNKDYNVIRKTNDDGEKSRIMLITPPEDYKIFKKFAGDLAESSTPYEKDDSEYLLNREMTVKDKSKNIMHDIMFVEKQNAMDVYI